MDEPLFKIGAAGIDAAQVVADIQATVARKTQEGRYTDGRVARAERANLANLKNEDGFMAFYLECLRDAVVVDINDFEIRERRSRLSRVFVAVKRFVWKLLKFYTYRLWSQQNQVNGLLLAALEGAEERYSEKIGNLERRVAELEAELKKRGANS